MPGMINIHRQAEETSVSIKWTKSKLQTVVTRQKINIAVFIFSEFLN